MLRETIGDWTKEEMTFWDETVLIQTIHFPEFLWTPSRGILGNV